MHLKSFYVKKMDTIKFLKNYHYQEWKIVSPLPEIMLADLLVKTWTIQKARDFKLFSLDSAWFAVSIAEGISAVCKSMDE